MFWLYLNRGRFFSTPMKTFLTIVNVAMIVVAAVIVSCLPLPFYHPADNSVQHC
jgi:hypothetical protein